MITAIADRAIIATLAIEALTRAPTEADRVLLEAAIRRERQRAYSRRYRLFRLGGAA